MSGAIKVGPWGAPHGRPCDINSYSRPMRLVSISICSNETPGGCINGFSFTYVDQTGEAISSGTWGTTIIGCVTTVNLNAGSWMDLNTSNMPGQLWTITIRSSERSGGRIYGFSYTYIDHKCQCIHVGPWGSRTKGQEQEFVMEEQDNYITYISGTHDEHGITSLKFVNSKEEVYGPFGCAEGPAFSVPLPENGAAVGFFGRATLDGIVGFGAYVAPQDD